MSRVIDYYEHDDKNSDDFSVTIFFSHCEHKCEGCQNPSTWNYNQGLDFNEVFQEKIFSIYKNDKYNEYGNLVLTGGDPLSLLNRNDILEFIDKFKTTFPDIKIWVYTGYNFNQLNADILKNIDVIKCGRYIKSLSTTDNIQHGIRLATSNQRIYKKGIDY